MAIPRVKWLNSQNGFGFIQLADGDADVFVHVNAIERAVRALAAKHPLAQNRLDAPVHVTTGRKLAEGFPDNAASVMVLLDRDHSFTRLGEADLDIIWGAYLGTKEEILVAGRLAEVMSDIVAIREETLRKHGRIADSYLLCRSETLNARA
ncbi:cold shock domain-containing protein [Methylocystis bryophila]|uniref:CSD domain-containing protein n=1 Tax=Methylocystis bryophila TaxID=655015 RepID=A0A1W6MXR5_9HYPH|nr:cold shock domain-containing protein [Methylocystis bryophila]ARN82353.1 hypothetical protein B1812_16085 [Methylocystis bryophila]BDV38512.1 hypothetical protein DSM21852_17650 [Methylocystis bryophila]